ncbi:MAG: hypothetical protein IPM56_05400 [Ignavibacteriales bacterium]|nr:MAG: hypothetical protein IPM56_05400 [Ignavibacteriales bacterium]
MFSLSCERPTDLSNNDDGIPPAVPSGLRVYYASDGEIGIEWLHNSEPDMRGYNVFRRTDSTSFQLIRFTASDFLEDDSLYYDTTYHYKISAVDFSGKESETTYEVNATPINRYNPTRPRYPEINARNWEGKKSIFTRWEKWFDTDISGYYIYRSEDPAFTPDSTTFVNFSPVTSFNDTSSDLQLNKRYYYRIKTVDKGGLLSESSDLVSDEIYDFPVLLYPPDGSSVNYFEQFKILSLSHPATYKIILQENQFFGEVWSKQFTSQTVDDTINIEFDFPYPRTDLRYYWRIITYSSNEPNSISQLMNFAIIQ